MCIRLTHNKIHCPSKDIHSRIMTHTDKPQTHNLLKHSRLYKAVGPGQNIVLQFCQDVLGIRQIFGMSILNWNWA